VSVFCFQPRKMGRKHSKKRGKSNQWSFPRNEGFYSSLVEGGSGKVKKKKRVDSHHVGKLVVAGSASLEELVSSSKSNPNPENAGLYWGRDRILLVGEGNFTFAAAVCQAVGGDRIVASSYDSKKEVVEKYKEEATMSLLTLRCSGAKVYHGIDATNADDLMVCRGEFECFDKIVFNFPHLGGATDEAKEANMQMLSAFFKASKIVLRATRQGVQTKKRKHGEGNGDESGEVHVRLRSTLFYDSWNLEGLAQEQGFRLVRKEAFDKSLYAGYKEARTNPAFRESPDTDNAFTHIFVLDPTASRGKNRENPSKTTQKNTKTRHR